MQAEFAIHRLARNVEAIGGLVSGTSAEQARWKPSPAQWSILEVINHLADEELEDFRTRLDLVLHHPSRDWPGIAPKDWVVKRGYNSRDLPESLNRFIDARQASLAWLKGLSDPDWDREARTPGGEPMQAGRLLMSWLAHDWHHVRQMTRLHYEYLAQLAHPASLAYAGQW